MIRPGPDEPIAWPDNRTHVYHNYLCLKNLLLQPLKNSIRKGYIHLFSDKLHHSHQRNYRFERFALFWKPFLATGEAQAAYNANVGALVLMNLYCSNCFHLFKCPRTFIRNMQYAKYHTHCINH